MQPVAAFEAMLHNCIFSVSAQLLHMQTQLIKPEILMGNDLSALHEVTGGPKP